MHKKYWNAPEGLFSVGATVCVCARTHTHIHAYVHVCMYDKQLLPINCTVKRVKASDEGQDSSQQDSETDMSLLVLGATMG